jgi:two-component system, LytTR family, response regulator
MPMRVLILEDEQPAVEHLVRLLQAYDKTIRIEAIFDSVKDIVMWLASNPRPDLIFMDIQVADGLCFDVFSQVQVTSPVIFTTAYQEYAVRAFKVNSVDYLLKPIDFQELKQAMEKYDRLFRGRHEIPFLQDELIEQVRRLVEKPGKNRFVIRVGEHLRSITSGEICLFVSQEKSTSAITCDNRAYIIDYSLDQLMELLDSSQFFRISRKAIINRDAITDIVIYSKSQLKIRIKASYGEPLLVSRDKLNAFKNWLDG